MLQRKLVGTYGVILHVLYRYYQQRRRWRMRMATALSIPPIDNRQQQQQSHNGTTKSSSPLGSSVHVSLAVAKMRHVGGFDNHINSSQVLHVDTPIPVLLLE